MENIRERRMAAGITQRDLARMVRCGVSYIGNLERGRGKPSKKLASLLDKALNGEIMSVPYARKADNIPNIPFRSAEEKKEFHGYFCDRYAGNPRM